MGVDAAAVRMRSAMACEPLESSPSSSAISIGAAQLASRRTDSAHLRVAVLSALGESERVGGAAGREGEQTQKRRSSSALGPRRPRQCATAEQHATPTQQLFSGIEAIAMQQHSHKSHNGHDHDHSQWYSRAASPPALNSPVRAAIYTQNTLEVRAAHIDQRDSHH